MSQRLRIVSALMRHTPTDLAGSTYQHVGPEDLRPYLSHLPDFGTQVPAVAATGTDGASTVDECCEDDADCLAAGLAESGASACTNVRPHARSRRCRGTGAVEHDDGPEAEEGAVCREKGMTVRASRFGPMRSTDGNAVLLATHPGACRKL